MFHGLHIFRFEGILVSHGDDDMEVKQDSCPERGVLVIGEEGYDRGWKNFNDDIKCLEVSLRYSNNSL